MVAMSGKSAEPRGSSGNVKKQQSNPPAPSSKPQPSAEALNLARIIEGASYPADIKDRIQQVLAVVPNKPEDEICAALNDHDYDPARAITWLLDAKQGEWTTSGRKGKKKGLSDNIVAPGDTSGAPRTTGGTSKAASTRESYGGGVVVTRDGRGKGRGRSTVQRGRGERGGRSDRPRQPSGKNGYKRDEPSATPPTAITSTIPTASTTTASEVVEESWDDSQPQPADDESLHQQPQTEEVENWDQQEKQGSVSEWEKPSVTPQDPVTWSDREDVAPPVFPEALPTQTTAATTTAECVVSNPSPAQVLCISSSDVSQNKSRVDDRAEAKSKRSKQKRLARSQIPSKPVEMPHGMASINAQFSTLGIDFVGARSHSPVDQAHVDALQKSEASSSAVTYSNSRQQQPSDQYSAPPKPVSKDTVLSAAPHLLAAPSFQPTHASSVQEPTSAGFSRTAATNVQHSAGGVTGGVSVLAPPLKEIPLPPPPREAVIHAEAPPTSASAQVVQQQQHQASEVVRSSNAAFQEQAMRPSTQMAPSSTSSVPGLPLSNAMGNLLHPSSGAAHGAMSTGYISGSSSVLLQSGKVVASAQTNPHVNAQHTSAQTAHTGGQAVHSTKHTQGPPGFAMYGQLMQPQYYMPPSLSGYYPAETVARYPFFPGSTDPSMGTAISREHTASGFAEQSKYVTRTGDGSSPVVTSHQQQQQQQGLQAQLGPPTYIGTYPQSPYFYYPPWFSGPAVGKPTTNSFSGVGNTYQTHHGNLAGYEDVAPHDFTKSYNATAALGKPVADSELSAVFKQTYESKPAGNAFNSTYGILPMPGGGVPMQMVAQQHESMQQSRGQQTRHTSKPAGFVGWPQNN